MITTTNQNTWFSSRLERQARLVDNWNRARRRFSLPDQECSYILEIGH
jgi:hypothetical protein